MDGRGRFAAALTAAFLCALGASGTAQAAHFTAQPASLFVQSGAGPFQWTFASDDPVDPTGPVAYKLSSETDWHRCIADGVATLADLPEGRYTVTIADDPEPCSPGAIDAPPTSTQRGELVVDGTPPAVDEVFLTVAGQNVTASIPTVVDRLAGVQSITWDPGDALPVEPPITSLRFRHRYAPGTWMGSVTAVDRAGNTTRRTYVVTVPPPPALGSPLPLPARPQARPLPVHDSTAPHIDVPSVARRILARRAFGVTVVASERSHLSASATLRIGRDRYPLQRAFAPLPSRVAYRGRQPVALNLAASARVRRAVRTALARHRAVRADVTILAVDAVGNKAAVTRTVRVVG